ncbi:MAG: hypothetical protein ACTH3P_11240 [Proteus vulgaris]|uniref:hypothetical protein n=1 Tax=Proteus vulgaris TaxID=585 RepID=UPI0005080D9D|nr:hypothetical protein [Proteus vulgaris]KGA60133.1 hypothetical protein DR95_40 [Proteus vulgaris]
MKPINRLYLSGDETHLVDVKMVLELSQCGRGFITAKTDTDYTGKLVRLDIGYTDLLLRYFTGYVERSQPSQNGFQKLFVRELVGVFDRMWPCSFQHPTLKQITEYLKEHSGLHFVLPDAEYVNTPIPHYTHNGTGYQLLNSLGKVFNIPDYVWYQTPDGDVFVGSWEDSFWKDKNVEIDNQFSSEQRAGNQMTIPMVQSLRPGVKVNDKRLERVALDNDNMTLTWFSPDAITGRAENRTIAQQHIDNAYPELSAGLHLPKFARVEAPTENTTAGDISDPFRPKYAVDVQMVDADGNNVAPVYNAVPLPLPMAGNESGMFQYPPVGSMVEIAFENGRADKPFIRQVLSHGNTLPDIKPGEQLQQQRQEVSQRVTQDGTWHRQTDQKIIEESMHREVKADTENRTVIARETTVQATDKTTVIGTSMLMAGAIMQIAEGDFSQATQANKVVAVGKNMTVDVGLQLEEKIGAVRSSIAGAMQKIMAPVVYLGNEQLNVMQCMLDTLDVVNELAALTASHTHNNTGSPLNASAISNTGTKSTGLKQKYSPVIG